MAAAATRPAGGGVEADRSGDQSTGCTLDEVFTSATSFRNAIRDDLDRSIIDAGWRKVELTEGGRSYVAFFRCALSVALAALLAAKRKQLRRPVDGVSGRREHPIDGEAFALHQAEIDKVAGEPAFILGVHLYSDCTLVSRSGGASCVPLFPALALCLSDGCVGCTETMHPCSLQATVAEVSLSNSCMWMVHALWLALLYVFLAVYPLLHLLTAHYLYPVRMRVVNDVTGAVTWHTIAFVPFVRTEQEPNAKVKGRARRCGVLQRTLYLALREAVGASHMGAELPEPIHGFKRAFFRVLLYCCDQMEERSILCLKSGLCAFPCSNCMVSKEALGKPEALQAPDRRAIITLQRQIELSAGAGGSRPLDRARRAAFKSMDSYNAFIPALACMAGLATPPNHMYKMIAFDALHVR